jgi:hypothetical protein
MGTEDEEDPPGPVTLEDAVLRTPLHRLPAGFQWGFWILGGALGSLPLLARILNSQEIRGDDLVASASLSSVLFAFYLLFFLGGHPRYARWVGLVCVGIIGAMIVGVLLIRLGIL